MRKAQEWNNDYSMVNVKGGTSVSPFFMFVFFVCISSTAFVAHNIRLYFLSFSHYTPAPSVPTNNDTYIACLFSYQHPQQKYRQPNIHTLFPFSFARTSHISKKTNNLLRMSEKQ
jgi:hypothetical protein